jgi:drug/metabolite transporter (DMT)-like permease
MGLGEVLSLASAVVWAFAVILFTRIGRQLPPFELNLIKNLIGFGLLLLTALLVEGVQVPTLGGEHLLLMIISGVIGIAVADTLYMKALNTIGAGSTGIVAALYSPFVILLSMLYLGESLATTQWLGLLAVISGVILISLDAPIKALTPIERFKGILFGASSVFLTALGVVIMKPILEQQPFFWSSSLRFLAGIIGMLLYLTWAGTWPQSLKIIQSPQRWPSIIIASLLGGYLAMMLWLAGYKYTDASIAAILNETTSIFIVFLAWLLLKESLTYKKLLGSALAFLGVCLVLLHKFSFTV